MEPTMSNTKIKLVDENRGVAREFDSRDEAEREKKKLVGLSSYQIVERYVCEYCNREFDSEREKAEHESDEHGNPKTKREMGDPV